MELKWEIQDELRKVPMKTSCKALMWDLLSRARVEDAVIPEAHTPSLTELEESTCLGRSTLTTYLRALEATGWVLRERPSVADSLNRGQRTQYRLAVGSSDLPSVIKHEKHKRKPRKDEAASDGSGADLVQEMTSSGDDLTKHAETGRESSGADLPRSGGRSGDEPELGQEMNQGRSGDDLNKEPLTEVLSSSVHQRSSPPSGGDAAAPQQPLIGDESIERKPKPETRNQRANRLTKVYYDLVPMSNFPAVSKIVAKAIDAGYDEKQITTGLKDLGGKPQLAVSLNTLRIAIEGDQKRPRAPDWRDVSGQDTDAWTKGTR